MVKEYKQVIHKKGMPNVGTEKLYFSFNRELIKQEGQKEK